MKKLLTIILFILPISLFAFYDHEHKEYNEHISPLENMLNSTENQLKRVYDKLNQFSKSLDETITGKTTDKEYKNSFIHLQTYAETIQDGNDDTGINVKIKIDLPQTKDMFRLAIENDDNKVSENSLETNETVDYKDDDINLSVAYQRIKAYFNIDTKLGLKLNSNPYVFAGVQARKSIPLSKRWDMHLRQYFRYSTNKELENTSAFEFHRPINGRYNFISHNEFYWNSDDQVKNTYNSLRLHQEISRRDILNYVTALSSNDNKSNFRTSHYDTYVSYKHFIRKWLYVDLVPRVFWSRTNDFDMKYAFRLNLGMRIGQ